MRKYAWLQEPRRELDGSLVYKIMLCEAAEGFYLFTYSSPEAVLSFADYCYDSLDELYDDWNGRIDGRGWIELEDPLPDCQQDAFLPLRIKGRDTGRPSWGKYETLRDGKWVDYPFR